MVIPKIAICPICGKRTYLRIEDGSYIDEYPIRVNCINCRTLIKGVYIMTIGSPYRGLHLFNAEVEDCDVDSEAKRIRNADYVADICGELPCKNVRVFDGKLIHSTPYLESIYGLGTYESVLERKERLSYFAKNMADWKKTKSTAFQLLDEGSIDYIAKALKNQMGEYIYECDHYLKSLHCLQEIILEETKYLFLKPEQDETIKKLLNLLAALDSEKLKDFIQNIGGTQELLRLYRKTIEEFSFFMSIYPNLLPAETYLYFKREEKENVCISTCTFSDVKSFYQDAYESLSSLLFIPVCLDNISIRGHYLAFQKDVENKIKQKMKDKRNIDIDNELQAYMMLDNGIKIGKLNDSEDFQSMMQMPQNSYLRNGIGHNNYNYDGITQMVIAYDLKNPDVVKYQGNLMDVAMSCIGMAKTIVCISEIILFLLRREFQAEGVRSIMHPRFYKKAEPNGKCPCGSGIKYKKCCMNEVETVSRKKAQ